MRGWTVQHDSLRLRLLLAIVGGVAVISAVAMILDYSHEYRLELERILVSLDEQASDLLEAHRVITDPNQFAHYVHRFCATMDHRISPGHHIMVLDSHGSLLVRSQQYRNDPLEQAMLRMSGDRAWMTLDRHRVACVRRLSPGGTTYLLAQYLDYEQAALRMRLVRRLVFVLLLTLAIILFVYLAVSRWVIRPLDTLIASARQWSARNFYVRAIQSGPPDVHLVAREFNSMAQQLEAQECQRLHELDRARQIQANLLPRLKPRVQGLLVAAEYRPVEHVAGDLYDVFALPDERTALAVLDVSGHGISSAMLTGVLKVALHWRLTEQEDLCEAMRQVNSDLLACTSDEHFATACVGVWEPGPGRWTYCAAGHPGGVLLRDGTTLNLPSTGFLLGALPQGEWSVKSLDLAPGDRIFLYTDGIVEAEVRGQPFGLAGLGSLLGRTVGQSLHEQTRAVIQAVTPTNGDRQKDDMTILAFQREGDPKRDASRLGARPQEAERVFRGPQYVEMSSDARREPLARNSHGFQGNSLADSNVWKGGLVCK
jgi:serine phosphatase RsbU (regulator of sigma subunit)